MDLSLIISSRDTDLFQYIKKVSNFYRYNSYLMTGKSKTLPIFEALLAAILFASSTPLSKLLIGDIDPIPLAAFLYLGSGVGAFLIRGVMNIRRPEKKIEAKLTRKD
ncbi:MAG: hypothetical protein ACK2TV_14675, partial [Anaerolineales bacterium]